ncbi:MAG: TRAP transporter fused permease subunit [Dehalococcoidales bacterium]|nr:TRAP transporter fused permease subunit [Dehalococcoidales bacterium]
MATSTQPRNWGTVSRSVLVWLSMIFAIFQLFVPVFIPMVDLQLKSMHIIFGISLALLAHAFKKSGKGGAKVSIWDWIFIAIIVAANVNIFFNWDPIYRTPGAGSMKDWVLGALIILVALEAARRSTGLAMPLIVIGMFVYVFMGRFIPGTWGHPGFSPKFVIQSVYFSPLGIYGSMTGYSSTFIAMLIIFGSLLLVSGGGATFVNIAMLIAGRFRGGPAKVSVISSALFGTISGSAVANISVVGVYSIPLMKKLGYSRDFAAGVEAMASTGGIITPPILGIVAFILAELIGVPYIQIAWYSTIPAILYYTGLFAGVHFEALRRGLVPVPKDQIPHWRSVISFGTLVPLLVPITVLIWLLLHGYALMNAGFYSAMTVVVLYLGSAGFSLKRLGGKIVQLGKALSDGGLSLAGLIPLIIIVGMLVNLLGITGIAPKVSALIVSVGGKYLIGGILVGAIVPLILGCAVPSVAAYVISAAIIAPALIKLKVDIVSVHMFLFYFSALAPVTPPNAIASIVAANIAGGNWFKVCLVAIRLGIVAFLMPFFFILDPALLGRGEPLVILQHGASAVVGAVLLASGLFGYMRSRTNIPVRILFAIAGFMLLFPSNSFSLLGIAVAAVAFVGEWLSIKLKWGPSQKVATDK